MSIEEINKLTETLNNIQNIFGYGGAFFIVVLILVIYIFWTFLSKRIEKLAAEISEENLKLFQSEIDKKMVRFSTTHQKQSDAIQDCFQNFQQLYLFIKYVVYGEKFTAPMKPEDEVTYLTTYRLTFKQNYQKYKLLFPSKLKEKIESIQPEIDKFIKEYIDGLMPPLSDVNAPEHQKSEFTIAGIWSAGQLEKILERMQEISIEIELEFRKIYGTDE